MKRIKRLRIEAGLTQEELGRALGVEQSTVSMWETGNSKPRTHLLPVLAKALGCTIDALYEEIDEAV